MDTKTFEMLKSIVDKWENNPKVKSSMEFDTTSFEPYIFIDDGDVSVKIKLRRNV